MEEPFLCKQAHTVNKPFYCDAKSDHSSSLSEPVRVQQPSKQQHEKPQSSRTHHWQPAARSGDQTVFSHHTRHLNTSHSQCRYQPLINSTVIKHFHAPEVKTDRFKPLCLHYLYIYHAYHFLDYNVIVFYYYYSGHLKLNDPSQDSWPFYKKIKNSTTKMTTMNAIKTTQNLRFGGNINGFHNRISL